MNVMVSEMKRATLLEISGRIDSTNAEQLGEAFNEQIDAGHTHLIADLSGIEFMSSAGIRELVSAFKRVRGLNGDLRLCSLSPRAKEVLEITGLDSQFKIFPTQVEAVGSF